MTLEEQIKALLEAKKHEEKEKEKDTDKDEDQDQEQEDPAVRLDNPLTPGLTMNQDDDSEEDSEEDDDKKDDKKSVKEDAQSEFETAKAMAMATDPNGDLQKDQFDATMAVQNETDTDESDTDAKTRFDTEKAQADAMRTESISDLLGNEFSAEFKLKAQTIFEAAVKDQVEKIKEKLECQYKDEQAKLKEEFQEKLEQKTKSLEEETSDKIDGYLSFLAESWKKENEVALEAAIKSELTESFISNLKQVFEQHYIDLPEDKVDLYSKAVEDKAQAEKALANTVMSVKRLTEQLNAIKREQIIEEATKDFASLDRTRFKTLTEDFAFDDENTFKQKVSIVKQSFFGAKSTAKEQLTEHLTITEQIVDTGVQAKVEEQTVMSAYVRALRGSKK
jgi:hypothetical protein